MYKGYSFYLYDAGLTKCGRVTDANNCKGRKKRIYNARSVSQAGDFNLGKGTSAFISQTRSLPWDVG